MMNKPHEYWVALAVVFVYVLSRSKDLPVFTRLSNATISAGLAYASSASLAEWTGRDEIIIVAVVGAFGTFFLDVFASLVTDKDLWRDILKKRLGGNDKD